MIKLVKKLLSQEAVLDIKTDKQLHSMFKNVLSKNKNQKWLDVGCGSTPYKHFFKDHSYTGIDIERDAHGQAKKLADKFYDGKNIPFLDLAFDGVLCTQVLGVCDDEVILVKEINRVLKEGAYAVIATPFIYREVEKPYDFRRFTSYGIAKLLEKNNFKVIQNIKILSGMETISLILNNYIVNNFKTKLLKRFIILFVCLPLRIIFSTLSLIMPDNRDLFCVSVILAKKINN